MLFFKEPGLQAPESEGGGGFPFFLVLWAIPSTPRRRRCEEPGKIDGKSNRAAIVDIADYLVRELVSFGGGDGWGRWRSWGKRKRRRVVSVAWYRSVLEYGKLGAGNVESTAWGYLVLRPLWQKRHLFLLIKDTLFLFEIV